MAFYRYAKTVPPRDTRDYPACIRRINWRAADHAFIGGAECDA
jgi:hypothetical protein